MRVKEGGGMREEGGEEEQWLTSPFLSLGPSIATGAMFTRSSRRPDLGERRRGGE